jgi:GNAT superfamily N-acetyltransferase
MTIRPSVPSDAPRLLEMGMAQHRESGWEEREPLCTFDADSFGAFLDHLAGAGILLVADEDGRAVGMVGALIDGMVCNRNVHLFKGVLWYCEPDARRKYSLALLSAIEAEAKARGVHFGAVGVDDGDRSPALSRLYRRAGYRPAEHMHIKRL